MRVFYSFKSQSSALILRHTNAESAKIMQLKSSKMVEKLKIGQFGDSSRPSQSIIHVHDSLSDMHVFTRELILVLQNLKV